MRLSHDTDAASPLVVLTTFVLGAVVVTALAYALFFDRPDDSIGLVEQRGDGTLAFNVTHTAGGLSWSGLTLHFLDRAGTDQASTFLHLPEGKVARGQLLTVQPLPPGGAYVLVVLHQGDELARLTVQL